MKKKIWLFGLPIGILLLIYVVLKTVVFPIVTEYANDHLKKLSDSNEYAEIQFEKIDFEVFDPRLKIRNIKIRTKTSLNSTLKDFEVNEVDLKFNLFELMLGKLSFNLLSVAELKLEVELDPLLAEPKSKTEFNISQLYDVLNMIPIQRFRIDNLNLKLNSQKHKIYYRINESFVRTSYLDNKFLVRAGIKNSVVKNDKDDSSVPVELNMNLLFSKTNLLVREVDLKVKENRLRIDGVIHDVNQLNSSIAGQANVSSIVNLQEIKSILENFNISKLKEKLEGRVNIAGTLNFNGTHSIDGNIDLTSENIIFDKFDLGTAIIKSEFKKDRVTFSNIELIHPAGKVKLSDSMILLKEPHEFKSSVSSEHFDIQKLFQSLDLKEIPVFTVLVPQVQCEGSINKFNIFCKAQIKGKGLRVSSEMHDPKSRIVEIGDYSATGEFFSDLEKIAYKGVATINDNTAESDGVVEYAKGFDIKFKSSKIDFKNIVSLANLDFKGELSLDGSTKGDSHAATFSMKVNAADFSLEKYNFGNLESMLNYKEGTLSLVEMKGLIGSSKYNGSLDLNLLGSEIHGAIDFEGSKLKDILTITKNVVPIPFAIDGSGTAKVKLSGPLDFWKLNYRLEAEFRDVLMHTEHFTDLKLSILAENGNSVFSNSYLAKRGSRLSIEGALNADKTFNLSGSGQGFRWEESEFVKSLNVPIFGDISFNYITKGPIDDPKLSVQINSPEVLIGEKQLEASEIKLDLNKAVMEWNMRLFNEKLNALVRWPFEKGASKVVLNSEFKNFDYTVLFPFIGAESIQDDYLGNLTGQTVLSASSSDLSDLDGQISIDDLTLQRGQLRLALAERGRIDCSKGEFSISELRLIGPDNIVEISGNEFTFDRLNIRVSAKSELRILHFLVPFLEEVSGPFELGARISGPVRAPRILGQALVRDAYVKIKNFPHPFEKINTTLVFSQSKIFVQNLKSNFAGGTLKSDGQIEIIGPNEVPLFLNISAENVNLNIPEKVRTGGNANLVMSGKWFPFLIAGTYNINSGIFEKELGGDDGGPTTKQSIYLPKSLKEKTFDPIALDINVFLDNKYLIKNSLVEGYANGNVQLKGPISNILIFGKVEMEKGTKLYFKDKQFELQSGLINFASPTEINPDVYITASARVNDYDINLLLQGPAKTANIKMTSSPPLAENEIISLLALGVTSSQLEQNVQGKDQAAQTGYEIGAAVLSQSALTKGLKNRLGLEIQFVNQFDTSKNASVLKATATKRITNNIQATASRAIVNSTTEVKVQYFFNNNLSAIGNWEGRESEEAKGVETQSQSVFGLDLEFKRDFR
ncbi:MAG: translocation/assembly module TamB domain-containing protein [Bdellovibrionaceae bacterium]|nr:translocation/assembly module TamB domain-containing protein [Pseudobdellovibrionaceae bacterium]